MKEGDKADQLPITYFFDYIDKVKSHCENSSLVQQSFSSSSLVIITVFMKNILKHISSNAGKNKHGNRYEYEFKMFCAHIYLVSGLLSYEILSKNIGNLPSPSRLNRLIAEEINAREREININGILKYFNDKKLPKIVWLSEDQTKIVERIKYNPAFNTLEGLSPPLNDNGVPILNYNLTETAFDIKNLISKYPKSTLINIVMIQPLEDNSASFCLLAYGTINKFTAVDVAKKMVSKYVVYLVMGIQDY